MLYYTKQSQDFFDKSLRQMVSELHEKIDDTKSDLAQILARYMLLSSEDNPTVGCKGLRYNLENLDDSKKFGHQGDCADIIEKSKQMMKAELQNKTYSFRRG